MENQLKIHSFNLEQTKLKFDQKSVDHVFFYKIKKMNWEKEERMLTDNIWMPVFLESLQDLTLHNQNEKFLLSICFYVC